MYLHDVFFLIALVSQFVIVWLLTAQVWFPKLTPLPAAAGQGVIAFCVAGFAGGALSALLWVSAIAFPLLFSWAATSSPDSDSVLQNMQDRQWLTWLISITPYLYLLIRLFGQVKRRYATQAWQSTRNNGRL